VVSERSRSFYKRLPGNFVCTTLRQIANMGHVDTEVSVQGLMDYK
jgi:hypothetical protein